MLTNLLGMISGSVASAIALVSFLIAIIAIIVALVAVRRATNLKNRYKALIKGEDGANLEQLILQNHQQVEGLKDVLSTVQERIRGQEERLSQKVGPITIERYNAFGEVGNDLSFSLSLIDEGGNGAVISSIYGREESRVYAKPLDKGRSSYTLTEEERSAISTSHSNNQLPTAREKNSRRGQN